MNRQPPPSTTSTLDPSAFRAFSWRRIYAMTLRHFYLLRSSGPRLLELAYWPLMQMIIWGFFTTFFLTHSSWLAQSAGLLLGAVMLWDVLLRTNVGLGVSFLEEMWSRNLGHMFVSPLRPFEFAVSLMVMSATRTVIGVLPAALLAIPLYHFNIFTLGLPLIAFFANLLIMGWWSGLIISGAVLRFGQGAESLVWVALVGLAPILGIYYPVSVLPDWLQAVAWIFPASYVFEGMRTVLIEGVFRADLFWVALALNGAYLALGTGVFLWQIKAARRLGLLLQTGE